MLEPNHARAHQALGIALRDQGRLHEAAASFRMAISLDPALADARVLLGDVLLALGRADEAVESHAIALRLEETGSAIAGFVRSLTAARLGNAGGDVRAMAIRALSAPWSRPSNLVAPAIRLLASDTVVRACIDRAWDAWPARLHRPALFGQSERRVFDDLLLRTLLESAPVCDLQMERFLTMARSALLQDASVGASLGDAFPLPFCCALARQSFINDYVFSCADAELAGAGGRRDRLVALLHSGQRPSAIDVAIVAAYFPLHRLPGGEALLASAWPEPVEALLGQQLREPMEELRWREGIPRLTTVDDAVSRRVQEQYEEHPYPKWVKLPRAVLGVASRGAAAGSSTASEPRARAAALDILVAGCGTGQESIEVAQRYPDASVLAVDLSLASLAYATRKAHELQVANVQHAKADVLKLAALGRRFDQIYSVGVLHHLADPMRGLGTLASLLSPGGRMLVGLYSEQSRQDVVAARAFIAERGYAATDADIRRCRQDLMSVEGGRRFSRLAARTDFYVTSECRDLLFHVQERRFTLPQLRSMLAALDLQFDGFVLSPQAAARYRARYGPPPGLADLAKWEAFEADFPEAFAGMYIFWVRREPEQGHGASPPASSS